MPLRGLESLRRLTQSPKRKSKGLPANGPLDAPNPQPKEALASNAPNVKETHKVTVDSSQAEGTIMRAAEKAAVSDAMKERATDDELQRLREELHELKRLRELDQKEREAERAEHKRILEVKEKELQRILEEARARNDCEREIDELQCSDHVRVMAYTADISRKLYFGSPAIQKTDLANYLSVQLETDGRNQGWTSDPEAGMRSWFELAILTSVPNAGQPVDEQIKVVNGKRCTWVSHVLPLTRNYEQQTGQLFGKSHEMWAYIDDGDIIGVLACAQFSGWKCEARYGKLSFKRVGSQP